MTITDDTSTESNIAPSTSDDVGVARPTHFGRNVALGVTLGALIAIGGAVGLSRSQNAGVDITTAADAAVISPEVVGASAGPPAATLDGLITQLQTRLDAIPADHVAWATLGIAYVQQAAATADPSFYERADLALAESLAVDDEENFLAYAGLSALASARHEFADARELARRGLAINDFNPMLYGALGDAELQLGNYAAAIAAAQRMVDLSPDSSSFARVSYLWELRGRTDTAAELMQQALEASGTPTDRAFALTSLGELSFNSGRYAAALDFYNQARLESPGNAPALEGKARSEAALGQVETALDHYRDLIDMAPEPSYIAQYGELLASLGRTSEAAEQYELFATVQVLFASNGVQPDDGTVLFLADHGDPVQALAAAEAGIAARPFLAMYDAYAWALHVNGRDAEALVAIEEAQSLGVRSALYSYHSGMIKQALGDFDGARADLTFALEINPEFNPLAAPLARAALAELTEGA